MSTIEQNIEPYRDKLIGRIVTNLFFTKQDGPHDLIQGVEYAYYFSTILEIDATERYRFGHDWIVEWDESKELILVNHDNWQIEQDVEWRNKQLKEIRIDEYNQIYFLLNNNIIIYHTHDWGDGLDVIPYGELYDEEGKVKASWYLLLCGSTCFPDKD